MIALFGNAIKNRRKKSVQCLCVVVVSLLVGCNGSSTSPRGPASTASPGGGDNNPATTRIEGPVDGVAFNAWPWSLDEYDYEELEFFITGSALPYGAEGESQDYKTRFMVYRPKNPADFNGIAIVEWSNVTAQFDIPLDLVWSHPYVFKKGYMYVTVSAQEAGICGDSTNTGQCSATSLKSWNAERYGSLEHPGDDYSFDMFSQIIQSLRQNNGNTSLDAYADVSKVIAAGQSQSGMRMNQYLCNGADADARVVDAVFSDADTGVEITCRPRVPTIQMWTEDSAIPVEVTSKPNHEIWMVAGAPHEDKWQAVFQSEFTAKNNFGAEPSVSAEEIRESAGNWGQEGPVAGAGSAACLPEGNAYPRRYVVDAAFHALTVWMTTGLKAPTAPPLLFNNDTAPVEGSVPAGVTPPVFQTDQHGNALGGLRLPVMDVPVATYLGSTCFLFGQSFPFSLATNSTLYNSEDDYIEKFNESVNSAVSNGFLLREDAEDMMRRACAFPVVGGELTSCPEVNAASYYD
ncbi:alpha/beta hydrolase domain-containing protein [Spongiibacter thalassae]|uniref:alpha/beta hydrolase domain-containing protein n=1 Tax=Spongiibacter thalassae TaxID=2721624 RepID=UPI0024A657CF|nr:alpha/beta hydrolase domain-containing protein [Spongiibacter thalassae]